MNKMYRVVLRVSHDVEFHVEAGNESEGLEEACDNCGLIVYERNLSMEGDLFVCPACQGCTEEEEDE